MFISEKGTGKKRGPYGARQRHDTGTKVVTSVSGLVTFRDRQNFKLTNGNLVREICSQIAACWTFTVPRCRLFSPLRFFLADDGRHRFVRTLFATVAFRLPSLDSSSIFCSNPAIAGDESTLVPCLAALSVRCFPRHARPFRHLCWCPLYLLFFCLNAANRGA